MGVILWPRPHFHPPLCQLYPGAACHLSSPDVLETDHLFLPAFSFIIPPRSLVQPALGIQISQCYLVTSSGADFSTFTDHSLLLSVRQLSTLLTVFTLCSSLLPTSSFDL